MGDGYGVVGSMHGFEWNDVDGLDRYKSAQGPSNPSVRHENISPIQLMSNGGIDATRFWLLKRNLLAMGKKRMLEPETGRKT